MAELAPPQSPHAARCFAFPLLGASPMTGGAPVTPIAAMACSAAICVWVAHATPRVRRAKEV